jgi:pimeloyl-ACP methyl ester carboxylesterase
MLALMVLMVAQGGGEPVTVAVPLEDGVLDVGGLLAEIVDDEQAGVVLEGIEWHIDFNDEDARERLRSFDRWAGDHCEVELNRKRLELSFDPETLATVQSRLTASADGWLGELQDFWSGGEAAYGVTLVTEKNPRTPLTRSPPSRMVVLVHGLDDPGWIWNDLAPALVEAGHAVARFEYRDDGPIVESSDALADALRDLKSRGVDRVDLVGHSLGGLVSRDVLVRPVYYDGDGRGNDALPAVDRMIMIGTPNRGAALARLHKVGEWRQQIVQALRGRDPWKGPINDGRGEVVADLIPGSDYLRRLNGRELPEHTRITIIAARAIPVGRDDLVDAASATEPLLGKGERLWSTVERLVDGIGDGVVTIESARIDGVDDFVVVDGNHMSMIHNLRQSSERVPPAIPIIIERLSAR